MDLIVLIAMLVIGIVIGMMLNSGRRVKHLEGLELELKRATNELRLEANKLKQERENLLFGGKK